MNGWEIAYNADKLSSEMSIKAQEPILSITPRVSGIADTSQRASLTNFHWRDVDQGSNEGRTNPSSRSLLRSQSLLNQASPLSVAALLTVSLSCLLLGSTDTLYEDTRWLNEQRQLPQTSIPSCSWTLTDTFTAPVVVLDSFHNICSTPAGLGVLQWTQFEI